MDTIFIVIAVIVAAFVGALLAVYMARRARARAALGPVSGSIAAMPLPAPRLAAYAARWTDVQSEFQRDREAAVQHADQLVREVMAQRGYPTVTFAQAAGDTAATTSPRVVENYRFAHAVALAEVRGSVTDADLDEAMERFRVLFQDLLDDTPQ